VRGEGRDAIREGYIEKDFGLGQCIGAKTVASVTSLHSEARRSISYE
jgi:hypothetical protein